MKNYTINTLFPLVIVSSDLERKFTAKELALLSNLSCTNNNGNLNSVDSYVLDKPELASLKSSLLDGVQNYMDTVICANSNVKAYITQSWVNYTGLGQFHHKHCHQNSYLSGVLYISADEATDKIEFYNDIYKQINLVPTEWNIFNSESWWYPVKTGQLLIFPSHLVHSVMPKQDSNVRISLAFNTFLKGNIGSNERLSELLL
jgi:uncharacterized protein (TIGR02466 family)